MSQQCAPLPLSSPSLEEVETADLRNQLKSQQKLVTAIERRVGRSLTSIQTYLTQLNQAVHDSSEWQINIASMAAELQQLGDLLADATLLQKIEAGKVTVQLEALDLHLLLDCVSRHLLAPKAETPRLICKFPAVLPPVIADRDLLEEVLTDLLGRSLKCSDPDVTTILEVNQLESQITISITAQRFVSLGERDFAPEIALCCKRVEVQNGAVTCQMLLDGSTIVAVTLPIAD
ncbi:sensor histidine kinase [Phormidesmis priestleyi ULC007]|uniref:Sensor histidine kinase n=1 Tax=Phormidesmis priestleyi ULC007 TaxID=1920490 RepID=A0A2T1DL98_9CYAN|nr:HAMP domain-containing histidine kinase [Phormidesmis priestleyi]PSB21270.1 sensor histidine kinase [Phormidesmis priestleyi ULC007]PZO50641.1 MAG: sensor histidine kinase [Phormidesmis priestleyi]